MGAGPLPVDPHSRRPPIPIVPVDEAVRAAELERGATTAEAWLAAVTGAPGPARVRVVDAEAELVHPALGRWRETAGMGVGEVALAVDAGRETAAGAAADGITLVVAAAPAGRDDDAARALAENLTGATDPVPNGALGALRRLGDATTAFLCGVALGAGEHGLGCVCDGLAALAGAAVAVGIEADVAPRLIAARAPVDAAEAALAERLGLLVADLS